MSETAARAAFSQRGLALLIGFGLVCAMLFAMLNAYAPTLNSGRNGGAHGLSIAGTGYSAIVALAAAAGDDGRVLRDDRALKTAGLLVLTPEAGVDGDEMLRLIADRAGAPVLVVLPKWRTVPQPLRPGWVAVQGAVVQFGPPLLDRLLPGLQIVQNVVKPAAALTDSEAPGLVLQAPPMAHSLSATKGLDTVLADASGNIVIGWIARTNVFVAAEPDLFNNHGVRDLPRARVAIALLESLKDGRPGGIGFDVTLNGFGRGRSLLRTAFEPPFLALTLSLLAAAAAACWYGLVRFGTPQLAGRAIAFGKRALVDNAASLVRMAGREAAMAPRYAAVMREIAVARLRAPAGLAPEAQGEWLDRRGGGSDYTGLAAIAEAASGRDAVLNAARALHHWQESIVHDRR